MDCDSLNEHEKAVVDYAEEQLAAEDAEKQKPRRRGRPRLSPEREQAKAERKAEQKRAAAKAKLKRDAEDLGYVVIPHNEDAERRRGQDDDVLEYPPHSGLEFHDLCEMFPLVEGDEFDALVDDIRQNDQHEPGTMYQGKILDGRNRYRATKVAGRPFRARQLPPGKDLLAFIISANIRRRHLSTEQKQNLIAQLLKDDATRSDRAIARNVRVDKNTVAAVRAEGESRGEIHHVEIRIDTKGRRQPARKPKMAPVDARTERTRTSAPVTAVPSAPNGTAGGQPNETPTEAPPTPLVDDSPMEPISLEQRESLSPTGRMQVISAARDAGTEASKPIRSDGTNPQGSLDFLLPPPLAVQQKRSRRSSALCPSIEPSPLDKTPAEIDRRVEVAAGQPIPAEIGHAIFPAPKPDPITAALDTLSALDPDQLAALADRLNLEMLSRVVGIFCDRLAVRPSTAVH